MTSQWITPFDFNMSISCNIYEGRPSHFLVATAQKIAIYSIIPLALVVFFEAIVKNIIFFTLANLAIELLNAAHSRFISPKKSEPIQNLPTTPQPAPKKVPVIFPPLPIWSRR